jgi:RHS repeat-associated protein
MRLALCVATIGILAGGATSSHAQGMGFAFTANSYTAIQGSSISGTIEMSQVNDIYDANYVNGTTYYGYYTDWYVHTEYVAPTEISLAGSGLTTINQEVEWPADYYGSENFTIDIPNNGSPGPDITATLSVLDYDPYFNPNDPSDPGSNYPFDYLVDYNPYYYYCDWNYCDPNYYTPATATVTLINPNSVMDIENEGSPQLTEGEYPQATAIFIYRGDTYNTRTVYYTVSGDAINGWDYDADLTGYVTIPAGSDYAEIDISTLPNADLLGLAEPSTLTLTLEDSDTYFVGNEDSVTITFVNDVNGDTDAGTAQMFRPTMLSFNNLNAGRGRGNYNITGTGTNIVGGSSLATMDVQATFPYAAGLGPTPGIFTITRNGGTNAFTLNYTVTGTAVAGSNYTSLPASVQFATNQTSTNLLVNVLTNNPLASAQTVVLTLTAGTNYFLGDNSQAVVTLLPDSSLTNSVNSPVGRYWRGSGSDPTYWSQVVPLDAEQGTIYSNLNGNASALYPGLTNWSSQTLFHYNAANSLPQTNTANRIAFNNPIVAFGERTGGTPLYLSQPYSFGIYAGDPLSTSTQIVVQVYSRANFSLAGTIKITPPNYSNTNSMVSYVTNGFQVTTNAFGLTTTLSDTPDLTWGASSLGAYVLTQTASGQATNYYYLVEASGYPVDGSNAMVINSNRVVVPSLLYTLEFEPRPAWRSVFLDQPQFEGSPLPPFYAGMTLAEMLTNTPPVTNVVDFNPSDATNLDDSPELRRSPILDNFVASMGNDPIALANYVINDIDLTDPMAYSDSGNVSEQSINPGGISRGALGTFMEKEGSPIDQCALLVYLLRQAGVPAVYEFAPPGGLKILDTRLSQMLRFQVHGAYSEAGQLYTTNTMISVNYPWVAAYIGTNWVHIFPWLKDYQIVEGLNLWDEMPTNYSSAYPWVKDYIYGKTNLLSLATNGDNTPSVIFPAFLKQTLRQNHPGISMDDLGVQILDRQHYYARWQDFPTPTWVTNVSTPIESLASTAITNVNPALSNIFDTVSVEIYSAANPTNNIQTGDMRLVDLHNREFYIYQTTNSANTNQILLSLILMPFRTNITTQYSFTNDSTLLSKQVLTMTLGPSDDQLKVRFQYKRNRALTEATPIDVSQSFFGLSGVQEINLERPLRKGDQAAICMDYGRVTQDMLNVHAQDLWQMENALRLNPSLTNSISPDLYEGAAMYLAGMSYYKNISDFDQINQNLNKVNVLSTWAVGLAKIGAARTSAGSLTNGIDPVLPSMDMFFYQTAQVGNGTVQPDSGQTLEHAQQNYDLLSVVNNSAEEHQIIDNYYQQTNAVSTVRLLQLSQTNGVGIVSLNYNNYAAQGQTVYQGQPLQYWDSTLWSEVANSLQNSPYTIAYITPGPMTNSTYKGMAALILGWNQWAALISPQSLNGAFGQPLPPDTVSTYNTLNYNLFSGAPFVLTLTPLVSGATVAPTTSPTLNYQNTLTGIQNGQYVISPFDSEFNSQVNLSYDLSGTGSQSANYANAYQTSQQYGFLGDPNNGGSSLFDKISDPVRPLTGEFYIDDTDLKLPGPMPLTLRRNYSSQDLADNQFGTGWKLNIMPYLSVTAGGTNIYAADMDGAVLTYVRTATNANVWLPTLAANPQLNNNAAAGMGSVFNRLRNYIVQTVNGSTTNYTLYGADGSTRTFQVMTFDNGILNQTRPYLQKWTDNRGNYYVFTYGTDSTQPNFGEVTRIQSSNGNYLGFDYDINAHIIDAYSGDGRRLTYDYDQYGDLTKVTLPDATTRSYIYQHATQTVTNNGTATYSTHLIIEEDKPEGRILQNFYDSQRRVTNQWSTAGVDMTPIRTGTFIYANNFNITNSYTNTISGYTLIIDGNNHTNRYDYTNSLITKITDPLGQTIQQSWYANNATAPGYPRSVATRTDKRGLVTQYDYDSNGNVTNTVITGDITGNGITSQTATNTAVYNANSLPSQITDAAGNSVVYVYDPTFAFLPQQIIRYAGATPVSTNYMIYGDATNVVVNGNTTQTNEAFGLLTREIRAYGSPDAATNDTLYNGNGFPIETIRYTGTGDPNITNFYFYNERGDQEFAEDALGAYSYSAFDAMDRLIEKENFDEFGNPLALSSIYYNENGEVSWTDGPRYNPDNYVYYDRDGAGRVTTEIHWRSEAHRNGNGQVDGNGLESPAGYNLYAQTFYEYDPLGNLTLKVDPRGAITTNTWNALCELVQTKHLDTNGVTVLSTEGYGYEPGGKVKYYTNALGGVTTTFYTITGKPESRINPDGSTNAWRYYLDGRIYKQIQRNGAYWQTTYDDVDRITTRTFYSAAGVPEATNSVQLDRRGNVIQKVDAEGNVFTNAFDGLDRVKVTAGPAIVTVIQQSGMSPDGPYTYITNVLQHVVTNFYDAAGRSVTSINALGEKTVTTFDAIGRQTSRKVYNSDDTLARESYIAYSLDHNSVTTTNGSGAGAIVHTTYTDTDGHTVLSIGYSSSGVLDYTWKDYDLAGNLDYQEHDTSSTGSISEWTFASYAHDGLNRVTQKIDRDNAITTYAFDPMGNLTNRTMPGNLKYVATYNNAGQMTKEWNVGGSSGTRTNSYIYYSNGNAFAGLLDTKTDGRGVTCTYTYDDWLRPATMTYSGSLPEQNLTTTWQYEARGFATNITEQFASTNTGPATSIQRSFDPYGQLASETVSAGSFSYGAGQTWDAAGRRSTLNIGDAGYGFGWQADGNLISANDSTGGGAYSFDTAGILTSRDIGGVRSTTIESRDGEGRPLGITTDVNGAQQLSESLAYYGDGLLATHTLTRSDFTDSRVYGYATLSRRLTYEQLNLNDSATWTNNFTYDNGVTAGPGVLTQMGQTTGTAGDWKGAADVFSRVNAETNNTFSYPAYGHVNGQATLSAWLDNQPISISATGTNAMQWRATMELSPGTHQLTVAALHPSGYFTAWATNSFTNSMAYQSTVDSYDSAGDITNRVWKNPSGTVERTQTLSWDARGRLHAVTERDASNSGYNWSAVYDALNRRLQTTTVLVSNGVASTAPPLVINSYYDPQVEFLELGVSYGNQTVWKLYGPDLNGKYGGLNGTGGFDAVSPYLNLFYPTISDARGDILGEVVNNAVSWNSARPTGYGAVPDYRPPALGNGANLAQSSAWRGHWVDITGFYQVGMRTYDPVAGRWLSFDPVWNQFDPSGYSFCGGDCINAFDSDGRINVSYYLNGNGQSSENDLAGGQPIIFSGPEGEISSPNMSGGLTAYGEYINEYLQATRDSVEYGEYVTGQRSWENLDDKEEMVQQGLQGVATAVTVAAPMLDLAAAPELSLAFDVGESSSASFSTSLGYDVESTAAGSQMTTVIGSGQDVAAFMENNGFQNVAEAQKAGYNVFDWQSIPDQYERNVQNALWFNDALQSGSPVLQLTEPNGWENLLYNSEEGYPAHGSGFLDTEIPMLQNYEGVNVIPQYVTPSAVH